MRAAIIIVAVLALTACERPAESQQRVNGEFIVEKLFAIDGCTVYRFNDAGKNRYFTNCKGSVGAEENCGKNCSQHETIETH